MKEPEPDASATRRAVRRALAVFVAVMVNAVLWAVLTTVLETFGLPPWPRLLPRGAMVHGARAGHCVEFARGAARADLPPLTIR